MNNFTHIDESGKARMVDVGEKEITRREATACSHVIMKPETLKAVKENQVAKGEVLGTARLAGIMASKRTPDLIPLSHPLFLEQVTLDFSFPAENTLRIEGSVVTTAKTGAEMEALTAVSVAALTVYDMCKATDRAMEIQDTYLLHKSGGKSGTYSRGAQE